MIQQAGSAAAGAAEGPEKLRALPPVLAVAKLPGLDAAIRAWAQTDPVVAARVVKADELRVRRVEAMLRAAGLDGPTAAKRAPLLLWAHIGSIGCDPALRGPALAERVEVLLSPGRRRARTSQRPTGRSRSSPRAGKAAT